MTVVCSFSTETTNRQGGHVLAPGVSGLIFYAATSIGCVHVISSHLSPIHFNFTRRNLPLGAFLFLRGRDPVSLPSVPRLPSRLLAFVSFLLVLKRTGAPDRPPCLSRGKQRPKNSHSPFCLSALTRRTIQIAHSLVSSLCLRKRTRRSVSRRFYRTCPHPAITVEAAVRRRVRATRSKSRVTTLCLR